MGVYLRSGNIRMTEQLLNSAEIRSSLQQMGGKRVAQRVNLSVNTGDRCNLTESLPHALS